MTRKWNPVTAVAAVFVVLACFAFLVSAVHGQTPRDPAGYPYNKMCYDRTGRLTHVYSDYLRQWVPAYGNLGVTEQRNARHYTDYYGTNWPPASGPSDATDLLPAGRDCQSADLHFARFSE